MNERDEDEDTGAFFAALPPGRMYLHTRCGSRTRVSGGDYTHICDPFWPCTSTYCCKCAGFAPLTEVVWADTGETVAAYRRRLAAETPGLLKIWRAGGGFLVGAALGAGIALLVALVAQVQRQQLVGIVSGGAAVGALVCYFVGTIILNRVHGIDYRRMR